MLNCQHHISWVKEAPGGLHQCILCTQVVTKKDVLPRMEDLPQEFERRWDAWEATRQQAEAPVRPAEVPPAREPEVRPPEARPVEASRPEPRAPRPGVVPRAPPADPTTHA